jgi:diguanylate cyclase (GGDEF)-like protein
MQDGSGNVAPLENPPNRLDISKETIIEFEKRNTKVLVVDDDEAVRALIREILRSEQIPTAVCDGGHEALDWIKREDFGMIITDIKLRDFDGMGLLKAAKVISPDSDVIIVTGYPTVETAVTAMRFGAAEYFTKPFVIEQLRKAVNRLIEKRILERKLRVEKHQMEIQRFDAETGLFTNRYFHLLFSHEITRSDRFKHPCSLLLVQISGLKLLQETAINHTGLNGNSLMKNLARAFRSCCRQIDFIARYSYDEFAFILPETDQRGTEVVSSRILNRIHSLSLETSPPGSELKLEPILGGVTYPEAASSKELLLSKANESLLSHRQ